MGSIENKQFQLGSRVACWLACRFARPVPSAPEREGCLSGLIVLAGVRINNTVVRVCCRVH